MGMVHHGPADQLPTKQPRTGETTPIESTAQTLAQPIQVQEVVKEVIQVIDNPKHIDEINDLKLKNAAFLRQATQLENRSKIAEKEMENVVIEMQTTRALNNNLQKELDSIAKKHEDEKSILLKEHKEEIAQHLDNNHELSKQLLDSHASLQILEDSLAQKHDVLKDLENSLVNTNKTIKQHRIAIGVSILLLILSLIWRH